MNKGGENSSSIPTLIRTFKFAVYGVPCNSHTVPRTLQECAALVLDNDNLIEKVNLTKRFCDAWLRREIVVIYNAESPCAIPSNPKRPTSEGNNNHENQNMLLKRLGLHKNSIEISIHGIAHAESWALDLFWDVIVRFCWENMPVEFYDNMVAIAEQEANHFMSWYNRLEELKCRYGSLGTHGGLWRAAEATKDSLLERLLCVNLIHEARGLDTYPLTMARFVKAGETKGQEILNNNFKEELTHVASGVRWFQYLCDRQNLNATEVFHERFPNYFKGNLRDTNIEARQAAGMPFEWISPFL